MAAEILQPAAEQRLLHSLRGEKTPEIDVLGISSKAKKIAEMTLALSKGGPNVDDSRDNLVSAFSGELRASGVKKRIDNFDQLNSFVDRNPNFSTVTTELRDDMVDGVAVAVQIQMNNDADPELRNEIIKARETDDYAGVEALLNGQNVGGDQGTMEGLGKEATKGIITSAELISMVRLMSVDDEGLLNLTEREENRVANRLRTLYDRAKTNGDRDEIAMVENYMADALFKADRVEVHGRAVTRAGAIVAPVPGGGDQIGDGRAYGTAEGMDRTRGLAIPPEEMQRLAEVQTDAQMRDWMTRTFVKMADNPLFVASWWQQASIVEEIASKAESILGYSSFQNEAIELKRHGYATLAALGMQAVDFNCGANPDAYGLGRWRKKV